MDDVLSMPYPTRNCNAEVITVDAAHSAGQTAEGTISDVRATC